MTQILVKEEASLSLPFPELSDDQFFEFCASNPEYRIERTAEGRIVIMSGTGGKTGNRNANLTAQLYSWAKKDRRGVAFDSSTLFLLPNRAMRSPDAAWVLRPRLAALTDRDKERYLPLSPDFVVELTSPSDRLPEVREKMAEWIANGCQLGWILHPPLREAHIYRPSGVEIVQNPAGLSGEGQVEGFRLDLAGIWDPDW
jgi:Uma2 family endonuclease